MDADTLPLMAERARLIVWAEGNQQPLLRDAIEQAELELLAVGSASSADAVELGRAWDVEVIHDLRQAILRDDADVLWLAAPEPLEGDERRLIRETGRLTISTEPRPLDLGAVIAEPEEAETARIVPLMRDSPGYRNAMDAVAEFHRPQCVNVCFGGGAGEGTLLARLFDALDLLHALCGEPEGVSASLTGPLSAVPESLGSLHGHLTANLRFTEATTSCLSVSDCAGSWFRAVTIIGEAGTLRISDGDCEWTDPNGEPIDTGHSERAFSAGELIGMQITRLLDRRHSAATAPPRDVPKLLAMCEAARVSCRTGQVETPQRMLQMLSKP